MAAIVLPEDISIKKIKEFHNQVLSITKSDVNEVVIDFSAVRRADLAVYQVLLACARECREKKKVLKIKGASSAVKEQMALCGLIRSNQ